MSDIKSSTLELVGKTPIVNASRYAAKAGVTDATILVKLEAFNPGRFCKGQNCIGNDRGCREKRYFKRGRNHY